MHGNFTSFDHQDAEAKGAPESSIHILKATAALEDKSPEELLSEIRRKTGDDISLADIKGGAAVPPMVRNVLRGKFDNAVKREREIIDQCCGESKEFGKIIFSFILLTIAGVALLVV